MQTQALLTLIRESIIGDNYQIDTPFGKKTIVYADYTASGRSLKFIENYMRESVLPYYANTHSDASYNGAQTNLLREQARATIKQAIQAGDDDKLIFCGSGATAAINKLIDIMNLKIPAELDAKYQFSQQMRSEAKPVVFIGPYEHHSNELPWRESIATVVVIPQCENGGIDIKVLEEKLIQYKDTKLKIGSFSAASNVTGIKSDIHAITRLLKQHQALSFWDYAAAAPYMGVEVGNEDPLLRKDAVFISPHKFVGGPGTPGVLVMNAALANNRVPAVPGGGTVSYVTSKQHRYVDDIEHREEGGTPAISESIRAGLVFKLQQDVGAEWIENRERQLVKVVMQRWQSHNNIEVLGSATADRLSIFSIRLKHQNIDLHYGFLVTLLNDLFGIQARGGCSCAGPYGHTLLDINEQRSESISQAVISGNNILRPGWLRLNFNYFVSDECAEFLISAIELLADEAWRVLPHYQYDIKSGSWKYHGCEKQFQTSLNNDIDWHQFTDGLGTSTSSTETLRIDYVTILNEARETLRSLSDDAKHHQTELPAELASLRWFA